jgi:hypothetical protein
VRTPSLLRLPRNRRRLSLSLISFIDRYLFSLLSLLLSVNLKSASSSSSLRPSDPDPIFWPRVSSRPDADTGAEEGARTPRLLRRPFLRRRKTDWDAQMRTDGRKGGEVRLGGKKASVTVEGKELNDRSPSLLH